MTRLVTNQRAIGWKQLHSLELSPADGLEILMNEAVAEHARHSVTEPSMVEVTVRWYEPGDDGEEDSER